MSEWAVSAREGALKVSKTGMMASTALYEHFQNLTTHTGVSRAYSWSAGKDESNGIQMKCQSRFYKKLWAKVEKPIFEPIFEPIDET